LIYEPQAVRDLKEVGAKEISYGICVDGRLGITAIKLLCNHEHDMRLIVKIPCPFPMKALLGDRAFKHELHHGPFGQAIESCCYTVMQAADSHITLEIKTASFSEALNKLSVELPKFEGLLQQACENIKNTCKKHGGYMPEPLLLNIALGIIAVGLVSMAILEVIIPLTAPVLCVLLVLMIAIALLGPRGFKWLKKAVKTAQGDSYRVPFRIG